ncbi:MAG: hypothetical protein KDE48_19120 [Anaerolineales bacterium]|nr:hypothetical protein [Anaerolineales bacterium]
MSLNNQPEPELHNRQYLAWAVLIGSFLICLVITVTAPLAANAFIQNASQDLTTTIQANQGTVGIDDESGVRRALIPGEPAQAVSPGASILTDATAGAIMLIAPPEVEQLLARLKIDSNTTLRILEASTPRYGISNAAQHVEMAMDSGRLRLTLLEEMERPISIHFSTPQGKVTIDEPGEYSLGVNNQATQIAVLEGTAVVNAIEQTLTLASNQRAEIPTGQSPNGPLAPERNLIKNGDFSEGFQNWSEYTWRVELADQPKGETEIQMIDGEPVLRFLRGGSGHADAQVRQSINQNVADYASIRVLVTLRILDQSLGVCGIKGSECPLFLRMEYIDENGANQVWQQGFYAQGTVDDNLTPNACVSCAVIQSDHAHVPLAQDFFYEVDLREEMARQGTAVPSFIENISLVASGHSFISEVVDVALVVED